MREKIEEVLNRLRPRLRMDGGEVELLEITMDKVVKIKLLGACHGCPMSSITLKMAIEQAIRDAFPDIKSVEAVDLP